MQKYVVNDSTQILISCNNNLTKIYEENVCNYCLENVNKIMNYSCLFYGSSLQGRRVGTQTLIGVSYRAPIIVEESRNLIFFPLESIRNKLNIWVNLEQISIYEKKNNNTVIVFKNNRSVEVPISYKRFDNQVMRSAKLESIIRKRKKEKNSILAV